jgi:glyoxylase-like metal-dependent hydrolase (beta-lactamase superfamily II)
MEVAPRVHRIEWTIGDKPMASYVVAGDHLILVDTGIPSTPESVYLPAIERLGRSATDVALVVITHADADHIGGNAAVRKLFANALLACHPLDQRWASDPEVIMAERYDGFLAYGLRYDPDVFDVLGSWMGPAEPMDLLLPAGTRIRIADDDWLEVVHVPGHTPGHILLFNPAHRYAIAGDAIFGQTQLDTRGGKSAAPPYTDVNGYRSTIATIAKLDPELLLTCHYPVMEGVEVKRFVAESTEWSEQAQRAVEEMLASAKEPITLGEAIERLDPTLGPFAAPRELQWALLAHLQDAVERGRARQTGEDEIIAWEAL